RIQRGDHAAPVRSGPETKIEGNAHRSFFLRIRPAHPRRRMPGKLLGGESLDARVRQQAGQGSREAKAIRQHVFGAALAELLAENTGARKPLGGWRPPRRAVPRPSLPPRTGRETSPPPRHTAAACGSPPGSTPSSCDNGSSR